jgi:hypothetical protein
MRLHVLLFSLLALVLSACSTTDTLIGGAAEPIHVDGSLDGGDDVAAAPIIECGGVTDPSVCPASGITCETPWQEGGACGAAGWCVPCLLPLEGEVCAGVCLPRQPTGAWCRFTDAECVSGVCLPCGGAIWADGDPAPLDPVTGAPYICDTATGYGPYVCAPAPGVP